MDNSRFFTHHLIRFFSLKQKCHTIQGCSLPRPYTEIGGLKTAVNIAPAMDMAPLEVTLPTFLTPPLTLASLKLCWLTLSRRLSLATRKTLLSTFS